MRETVVDTRIGKLFIMTGLGKLKTNAEAICDADLYRKCIGSDVYFTVYNCI